MRTLVCTILSLLVAGAVHAEPDAPEIAVINNAATNGATITTNSSDVTINGYLQAIIFDISGASSPTVDIDVVTAGTAMPRITLLSINSVTADAIYFPRGAPVNTAGTAISNEGGLIPIVQDKIEVWLSNANKVGITGKVEVIYEKTP